MAPNAVLLAAVVVAHESRDAVIVLSELQKLVVEADPARGEPLGA